VTFNAFCQTIPEGILDYVIREMSHPTGGFYSTSDAAPTPPRSGDDRSKGARGESCVWLPDEIRWVLGDAGEGFTGAYGATRHSNASTGYAHGFEGKNSLEFVGGLDRRSSLAEGHAPRSQRVGTAIIAAITKGLRDSPF
jgi:uncharacterized protein YyaL (SSP411 family)